MCQDLPSSLPTRILKRILHLRERGIARAEALIRDRCFYHEVRDALYPYILDNLYNEVSLLVKKYRPELNDRYEVVTSYIATGQEVVSKFHDMNCTLMSRIAMAERCMKQGHPAQTVHMALDTSHRAAISDFYMDLYRYYYPDIDRRIKAIDEYQ